MSDVVEIPQQHRANWYEMVYDAWSAHSVQLVVSTRDPPGGRTKFKSKRHRVCVLNSRRINPESQTMANAEEALDLMVMKWLETEETDQRLLPYFEVFDGARPSIIPSIWSPGLAAMFIEERQMASGWADLSTHLKA